MLKARVVLAVTAMLALLTPSWAAADPITITGGTYELSAYIASRDSYRNVSFSLSGDGGFFLAGLAGDVPTGVFERCAHVHPCAAGTTISGSTNSGFAGAFGPATLDGVAYDLVRSEGGGHFAAADTVIPENPGDAFDLQSPFTFTGRMLAFALTPQGQRPIGDFQLAGQGTETIHFVRFGNDFGNGAGFGAVSRVFTFSDPAASATPEPASLLLLGTGAALIVRRKSRRQGPPTTSGSPSSVF